MIEQSDLDSGQQEPVFKRAVVAAAFSPRLTAVLNESHRLLRMLGSWPIIVHAGEETAAQRVKLEEAIDKSNFKEHPPICVVRNGQPAEVLIEAAKEYNADLIVAGALKKEGFLKYYLGSVARSIARHAPCSVLLLTEPQVKPEPYQKIHCAVEYDDEARLAVQVAVNIAREVGTRDLYFTHSFRIPELADKKVPEPNAKKIRAIFKHEDDQLKSFVDEIASGEINYQTRCLLEKNRATTLEFTREILADLFIVHGPRGRLGLWDRLFPQQIELALQNLPCAMLMTR